MALALALALSLHFTNMYPMETENSQLSPYLHSSALWKYSNAC